MVARTADETTKISIGESEKTMIPPPGAEQKLSDAINNACQDLKLIGLPASVESPPAAGPSESNGKTANGDISAGGQAGDSEDEYALIDVSNLTQNEIQDLWVTLFDIGSLRLGEHWKLTDIEAKRIGKATKTMFNKWSVKISPELTLIATAGMIVVPRAFASYELHKRQKKESNDAVEIDVLKKKMNDLQKERDELHSKYLKEIQK